MSILIETTAEATVSLSNLWKFSNLWKNFKSGFIIWTEVVGYSRAAAHLAQLGYHAEAKACMMELSKIKNS